MFIIRAVNYFVSVPSVSEKMSRIFVNRLCLVRHIAFNANRTHYQTSSKICFLYNWILNVLVWFDFCFRTLQHILGHFGRGQLP